MFSEEELKWELFDEYRRKDLQFSNRNKAVKHIAGIGVWIKLEKNSENKDKKYKVIVKSRVKDKKLWIGVCCEKWERRINYNHFSGTINDNGNKIKQIEKKLKRGDSLVIIDQCVKKIESASKIYSLSIESSDNEKLFDTFYQDEERKHLYLKIEPEIEIEVEVEGKIMTSYVSFKLSEINAYSIRIT